MLVYGMLRTGSLIVIHGDNSDSKKEITIEQIMYDTLVMCLVFIITFVLVVPKTLRKAANYLLSLFRILRNSLSPRINPLSARWLMLGSLIIIIRYLYGKRCKTRETMMEMIVMEGVIRIIYVVLRVVFSVLKEQEVLKISQRTRRNKRREERKGVNRDTRRKGDERMESNGGRNGVEKVRGERGKDNGRTERKIGKEKEEQEVKKIESWEGRVRGKKPPYMKWWMGRIVRALRVGVT